MKRVMKTYKILLIFSVILLISTFNTATASAYVKEHDGVYEIYYDDESPEFMLYWTYIGTGEYGYAVEFTPPFTPLLVTGAYFYLYDAYDIIIAVYDKNRNEIYREEFQVSPEDRGTDDWFSAEFTKPVRIDEGDFYIALILKTPAHPKLGADSTPPYNGRSYWIHRENGDFVWENEEDVAAEEGWTPNDFCISALVVPIDTDGDGLYDHEERVQGTDVQNPDTDGDGLEDGEEVNVYQTDPLNADTDGDGLKDGVEVLQNFDPKNPDMDNDGLLDGDEVSFGTNVQNPDTDGDGLSDGDEVHKYKTNPTVEDTDMDGIVDGTEVDMGLNPLKADSDGDGLKDSIDPMPTSALMPNGLIGLGVVLVALAVFLLRRRPKPVPKPPTPTAPPTPPPRPLRVHVVPVCPKCGAEIPEGAEYCPECGTKLKK